MKIAKILKKFSEIDANYYRFDFHMHSTWTDGKNSIAEMLEQAKEMKMNTIAITDHIRTTSTYYPEYAKEIRALPSKDVKVLVGFEARIKNFKGELDVAEDVRKDADVRIGSVHRFPFAGKLFEAKLFSKEAAFGIELDLCLAGLEHGGFDILGHPAGMCLKAFDEFPIEYFEQIIIACKKNNIAFEVSVAYHSKMYQDLLPLLEKHDPLVIFSSDAHAKENLGKWNLILKK
jgi:putative hydrolase